MKLRLSKTVISFVLIMLIATILFAIVKLLKPNSNTGTQRIVHTRVNPISQNILDENSLPGTPNWQIPDNKAASTQVQAYSGATSVLPGQPLTFFVSTQTNGMRYSIDIYRLGWYRGTGGRLMSSFTGLKGLEQGYYDKQNHLLVNCGSCRIDLATGLVEADWTPSFTFKVPSSWLSGVYLAKFTDAQGMQTYAPFDVRSNSNTLYIAVTPDTTDVAYNDWGGYSLYQQANNREEENLGKAVRVSFNRPFTTAHGSGDILLYEINAIHWLERQGYDISYISNVDLHEHPRQLLNHLAYLSLGHDEYWTKEMRDGVEYARNQGVSLAFLGANDSYWQMRFEADSLGNPARTIVCYKVLTNHHDLTRDPLYGVDNTRVTSQWRDPVLNRPENALIGIMYSSLIFRQSGYPWQVNLLTTSALLEGTGLRPGQRYGCGLVGYEWDRIFMNGASPHDLQVLGVSPTIDEYYHPDSSNTTYYIASSGAVVFAAGSIYWTSALDDFRFHSDNTCRDKNLIIPGMQKLLAHVMSVLVMPFLL